MNREECITTLILHGLEPVTSISPPLELYVCRPATSMSPNARSHFDAYIDAYWVTGAHKDGGANIHHAFLPKRSVRYPEANWDWFDTVDLELLASSNAVLGKSHGS